MAVITQEYDIDLKATGWYPVVEMSQYDTGSRTVVLRVYDGSDLVPLDGCVARIDGRRSDGVEFSASCTIGANSTVSFVVSQEMTRAAGKHVAELVIIDAQGNTAGTQNFILDVEPASMLRDAAASADDRTLYDQFTGSVGKQVADKMAAVDSKMAGVDDKMTGIDTQITTTVDTEIDKRFGAKTLTTVLTGTWTDLVDANQRVNTTVQYDAFSGIVYLDIHSTTSFAKLPSNYVGKLTDRIPEALMPTAERFVDFTGGSTNVWCFECKEGLHDVFMDSSGYIRFFTPGEQDGKLHRPSVSTAWAARGGRNLKEGTDYQRVQKPMALIAAVDRVASAKAQADSPEAKENK